MCRRIFAICFCALAALLFGQMHTAANAAAKKAPETYSIKEFQEIVEQALGNSSAAFGARRTVSPGAFLGAKKAYFYRFANATVGMASGGISIMNVIDKSQEDGETCVDNKNDFRDIPSAGGIILGANSYTCTKAGKPHYFGFVKFIDERGKTDHLFWVYGTDLPYAAATAVRDRIFERMRNDYAN